MNGRVTVYRFFKNTLWADIPWSTDSEIYRNLPFLSTNKNKKKLADKEQSHNENTDIFINESNILSVGLQIRSTQCESHDLLFKRS